VMMIMMTGLFVQFDVINLHVMVLRVFDFPEIRRREGRTFLTGISGITVVCLFKRCSVFKVGSALVNTCVMLNSKSFVICNTVCVPYNVMSAPFRTM
jgi:hypothetical protein